MKANYKHTSGNLFYQLLIVAFLLAIVGTLMNCTSIKPLSDSDGIDFPAIIIKGSTHQLVLPAAGLDSIQLHIWYSPGWDKAIGHEELVLSRSYTSELSETLRFDQTGLYLIKIITWQDGQPKTKTQRTEVLL